MVCLCVKEKSNKSREKDMLIKVDSWFVFLMQLGASVMHSYGHICECIGALNGKALEKQVAAV